MPVNTKYTEFSTHASTLESHVKENQHLYGSKSLSKILTKNIKDSDGNELTGTEYIGRVFKNLGDVLHVKFARLMSSFSEAKWVGNKAIRTELTDKISDLTAAVMGQVINQDDRDVLKTGIEEMKTVCALLKDRGVKNIDSIITQLTQLNVTLGLSKPSTSEKSGSKPIAKKPKATVEKQKLEEKSSIAASMIQSPVTASESSTSEKSGSKSSAKKSKATENQHDPSTKELPKVADKVTSEKPTGRKHHEKEPAEPAKKELLLSGVGKETKKPESEEGSLAPRRYLKAKRNLPSSNSSSKHVEEEKVVKQEVVKEEVSKQEKASTSKSVKTGSKTTDDLPMSEEDSTSKGFSAHRPADETTSERSDWRKRHQEGRVRQGVGRELQLSQTERRTKGDVGKVKIPSKVEKHFEGRSKITEIHYLFGKKYTPDSLTQDVVISSLNENWKALIHGAQGNTKVVQSLGKWKKEASDENKLLKQLGEKDFSSKMKSGEILQELKKGVNLVGKGYKQAFNSVPSDVLEKIDNLNLIFGYLIKFTTQEKTAKFNEKYPSDAKEVKAEDLSSPKQSIVDDEVHKAGSAPSKRENVTKRNQYVKAINQKKDEHRKHLEKFINDSLLDSKIGKSFSDEEKLQFEGLIRGNVRELSRHDIKQKVKTAKSIIKSKYEDTEMPKHFKEFSEKTKELLSELKSLELEKARYTKEINFPLGESDMDVLEEVKAENLEKFESTAQPEKLKSSHEYEDLVTANSPKFESEHWAGRSKDDTDVKGMHLVWDPELINVDIKRDLLYLAKALEDHPGLGSVRSHEQYKPSRLRELSDLSYHKMNKEQFSKHINEIIELVQNGYDGEMPKQVRKRFNLLKSMLPAD